jgi:hypothetical protein
LRRFEGLKFHGGWKVGRGRFWSILLIVLEGRSLKLVWVNNIHNEYRGERRAFSNQKEALKKKLFNSLSLALSFSSFFQRTSAPFA